MKKHILIAMLVMMSFANLHAQEGEIIYRDFEPDTCVFVGRDSLKVDIDNDGAFDMWIRGYVSCGALVPVIFTMPGWEICSSNENTILNSDTLRWMQQDDFPNHSVFSGGYFQRSIGLRYKIEDKFFYGWMFLYFEQKTYPPIVGRNVFIDKFAYCTIPNYPLRWGQTEILGIDENSDKAFATLYPNPTNATLSVVASSLANKCDEKLQNYDKVIAWYENVITDSTTNINDSIFARIDLMELYMQMNNNDKGMHIKVNQMIPENCQLADYEQMLLYSIPNIDVKNQQEYASPNDPYPPIENLEALFNSEDNIVTLYWNLPIINSTEMRLSWASTNVGDYVGYADQQQLAHRFDTTDLSPFIGWRIKDVSIYGPFDDGMDYSQDTISIMVWLADKVGDSYETEEIYRSKLPDFLPNQLYTIALDTNIYIQGDRELWIGYEFMPQHNGYGFPFAIDNSPLVSGKGNVGRYGNGNDWNEWLSDIYLFGHNYMISSTIENPNSGLKKIGNIASSPEITGFRIYRDEVLIADIPHPIQTFYIDENPDVGNPIEYCVTLVFNDGTESSPICITVDFTNILTNEGDNAILLFPNPTHDFVHIDGEDILEVKLYDNIGQFVNSYLNSKDIDLSRLSEGVYTLHIISREGLLVKRVIKVK